MIHEPGDDYPQRGPPELTGGQGTVPVYSRRLSVAQRLVRLLTSPKDAMEDISLAPEYGGVVVIIVAVTILSGISVAMTFTKIQYTGPYAADITSLMSMTLGLAIFLVPVVLVVRWLVKSFLVKYGCDNGSGWTFKHAASVTGYAYLVSIIMGVIGLFVTWYFIPSIVIDTTNLEAAIAQLEAFQAQIAWLQILYTIPAALVELVWKSYLGGLGAHMGTRRMCSFGQGIAVFVVLGFIGLALDFFG